MDYLVPKEATIMRTTQRRISFTTFMDFMMASGTSKLTKVRAAITMYGAVEYRPADYYLDIKHAINRCFSGHGTAALDACLDGLEDARKQSNYTAIIDGLRRWIGRKRFDSTFVVPAKDWVAGG